MWYQGGAMIIKGIIRTLKARIDASGNTDQTIQLEVHGDFADLHSLLNRPLKIEITDDSHEGM